MQIFPLVSHYPLPCYEFTCFPRGIHLSFWCYSYSNIIHLIMPCYPAFIPVLSLCYFHAIHILVSYYPSAISMPSIWYYHAIHLLISCYPSAIFILATYYFHAIPCYWPAFMSFSQSSSIPGCRSTPEDSGHLSDHSSSEGQESNPLR